MAQAPDVVALDGATVAIDDVVLLAPVSLTVPAGGAVAIRGRNGTGKTTLLELVAGVRTPSQGTVRVAGHPPRQRDAEFRRMTASMIGTPPIAPDLTVRDHLLLIAHTWFTSAEQAESTVHELMTACGLHPLATRFSYELSSGQEQLFGLAMTLTRPSTLLLLDEPEQRLDPAWLERVLELVNDRKDAGASVLVATHSDTVSDGIADEVVWLGED